MIDEKDHGRMVLLMDRIDSTLEQRYIYIDVYLTSQSPNLGIASNYVVSF
jgi:hypothetical protein